MSKALKYAAFAGVTEDRKRRAGGREPGGEGGVMGVFTYFPLLAIPVVIYNLMAWGGALFGGTSAVVGRLNEALITIPMVSMTQVTNAAGEIMMQRTSWALTPGDLLLSLALFLLFIEILKSTGTGRSSIANHALSLVIFVICLIEFLLFAPFATSAFFLLTIMTLLDVLAGFVVTIVTARRDIAVGEGFE